MATRKIEYKPLGVRLRSLPQIEQTQLAEQRRGLLTLSQKLDQISAQGFREFGEKQAIKGAEEGEKFKAYKVETDELGNTNVSFADMPSQATDPYSQAYYKSAQTAAKLQIKGLFETKLFDAYTANRADISGFNKASQDIKDGLLEALREKNPQLYNYFAYDFEQSTIPYAKSVYTNWSSGKNDIETTTFQGYMNSGHAGNIIKGAAKGDEGLAKAGQFVNNMVGDYLNLGPKEEFTAGNIFIPADNTRLGIKKTDAIGKDIIYARKNFQKIYLEETFKQYKGNAPALIKAIDNVRNGTFKTKDFFAPVKSEEGTIIGVQDANIADILNTEDRETLANDLFTIFNNETDRVNKIFENDKKLIEYQAGSAQSKILLKIINLQDVDPGTDTSGLEKEIEREIDLYEKTFVSEKGQNFAKDLRSAYFNRYNADDDTPGVKTIYEEDARLGMLNKNELLKDNRLTGKSKTEILNMNNSYEIGDKHWTDHNLYKKGQNIINGLEATSTAGALFNMGSNNNQEKQDKLTSIYRKTFEDLIDTKGIGLGRSGDRINPLDVASVIQRLDQEGKIIITETDFKKAVSGQDQATGNPKLQQYNTLKKQKQNLELKLTTEKNSKKIKEDTAEIERLKVLMKDIEDSIPGGIADIENKAMKMDRTKVYFKDDKGNVLELTPRDIYNYLATDPFNIINDKREAEYKSLFELTGSN